MYVFRTADVAPERRAASWSAVYSARFAPVNFAPAPDEQFNAELRVGAMEPVDFAQMRSGSYRAERTKAQAAAASTRKFGFVIVLSGRGVVSHCGREAEFGPGDVLINDNTEPLVTRFEGPFDSVTVRAREDVVRTRLPFVDDIRGLRLPAAVGLTRAVPSMAKCLAEQAEGEVRPEHGAAMAGHLLDVLATSYVMACGNTASRRSAADRRRAAARRFIEANLAAPDLSGQQVAAALGISTRYLYMLMAEEGETAPSLILRRRLEETAKELASPLRRDRTITDIALSWGFNSTAHFARVFKAHFGMTPRDYRRSGGAPERPLR